MGLDPAYRARGLTGSGAGIGKGDAPMQKWEYLRLTGRKIRARIEEAASIKTKMFMRRAYADRWRAERDAAFQVVLDDLGSEGWELVTTLAVQRLSVIGAGGTDFDLYFKRPKAEG